jgi:hypothetical protein
MDIDDIKVTPLSSPFPPRFVQWLADVQASQGEREAGAPDPKITPAMIAAARDAFNRWMNRWDYLADGLPADSDVDELLRSIIVGALGEQVDAD